MKNTFVIHKGISEAFFFFFLNGKDFSNWYNCLIGKEYHHSSKCPLLIFSVNTTLMWYIVL